MAIRIEPEQLPRLAEILFSQIPSSLKIYGSLKSTIKWGFPQEFWVDQWPGVTSVAAKKPKQESSYSSSCTLFSVSGDSFRRLLDTPGVVAWAEPVMFPALSLDDLSTLEDAARRHDSTVTAEAFSMVDIYYIDNADFLKKLLPEEMTLGKLSTEHAKIVKDSWKHGFEEPLSFFETLIQCFPNVGLFDKSGDLAAFEMMMFNGSMGFLFVRPAHRKKGFARYLTNVLAQKVVDFGEIPYVFIERDNEASIRLHESAGFQKLSGTPVVWARAAPNMPFDTNTV